MKTFNNIILECNLHEAKSVTIDIDWASEERELHKGLSKEYGIQIKPGRRMDAVVTGDPKKIVKFLKGPDYDMDMDDIKDFFPELFESIIEIKSNLIEALESDKRLKKGLAELGLKLDRFATVGESHRGITITWDSPSDMLMKLVKPLEKNGFVRFDTVSGGNKEEDENFRKTSYNLRSGEHNLMVELTYIYGFGDNVDMTRTTAYIGGDDAADVISYIQGLAGPVPAGKIKWNFNGRNTKLSLDNLKIMLNTKAKIDKGGKMNSREQHYFGSWSDAEWHSRKIKEIADAVKQVLKDSLGKSLSSDELNQHFGSDIFKIIDKTDWTKAPAAKKAIQEIAEMINAK